MNATRWGLTMLVCVAIGCGDRRAPEGRSRIVSESAPAPALEPPSTYVDLAVGRRAVCGIRDAGAVRCWFEGERTDAVFSGRARALALGQSSTTSSLCVLVDDGTIACGRLGARPLALAKLDGISGVSAIAPRGDGFCAIAGGAVSCWDTSSHAFAPVALTARAEALFGDANAGCRYTILDELECGRDPTTCARLEGGRIACWSAPERDRSLRGKELPALAGVADVTLIPGRISWIDSDGAVRLADLDVARARTSNVRVLSQDPPALEWAGSEYDFCVRARSGEVVCRGNAVPSTRRQSDPPGIVALTELHATTRLVATSRAICAIDSGRPLCWGENRDGRLGVRGSLSRHPPLAIGGIEDARALFVMDETVCVTRAGSGPVCWGKPFEFAREHAWSRPIEFPLRGVKAIANIWDGGCAITDDAPYCWGSLSPRHATPSGAPPTHLSDDDGHEWAVAATTGEGGLARIDGIDAKPVELAVVPGLACVRTDSAAMHCWYQSEGRRGEATLVPRLSPPEVVIASGVERVGAFGQAICARSSDGSMRCVERIREVNANGPYLGVIRLADHLWPFPRAATTWSRRIPIGCGLFGAEIRCLPESALAGIAPIRATSFALGGRGVGHAGEICALVEGGSVACLDPRARPTASERTARFVPVDGIRDAVDVGLGREFGCALLRGGRLVCWGQNRHGVLAREGDVDDVSEPRDVERGEQVRVEQR